MAIGSGPHIELGQRLCNQGRTGYDTSAFGQLRPQEIVAVVSPDNVLAVRVVQKMAMTYRRCFLLDGVRIMLYALTYDACMSDYAVGGLVP